MKTTTKRRLSFERAKAQYVHRYTMEHVPAWARTPCNGMFYAPQYRSDKEWYDSTVFPGEGPEAGKDHCYSSGQTWPLGQWLTAPYSRQ
jgi:hypothetical protein